MKIIPILYQTRPFIAVFSDVHTRASLHQNYRQHGNHHKRLAICNIHKKIIIDNHFRKLSSIHEETCNFLKCSHSTAYGISVSERTLIYVRSTLDIRRVRFEYADKRRRTLCYTERPNYFLDMFKIYQRMRTFRKYVTNTLTIRTAYARYARHIFCVAGTSFWIKVGVGWGHCFQLTQSDIPIRESVYISGDLPMELPG